jgi:hypothetical protein
VSGIVIGVIVVIVVLIAVFSSSVPKKSADAGTSYSWHSSYANALYLSADKKPVLLTVARKTFYDRPDKNADYIAFNDVRDGSVIALLPCRTRRQFPCMPAA